MAEEAGAPVTGPLPGLAAGTQRGDSADFPPFEFFGWVGRRGLCAICASNSPLKAPAQQDSYPKSWMQYPPACDWVLSHL